MGKSNTFLSLSLCFPFAFDTVHPIDMIFEIYNELLLYFQLNVTMWFLTGFHSNHSYVTEYLFMYVSLKYYYNYYYYYYYFLFISLSCYYHSTIIIIIVIIVCIIIIIII